jgi:hypothetical protein
MRFLPSLPKRIRGKGEEIRATSERLQLMGERGQRIVQENRNYRVLADHLFNFFETSPESRFHQDAPALIEKGQSDQTKWDL